MATATESPNDSLGPLLSSDRPALSPQDKYRGAVVEVHRRVSSRPTSLICLQDLQLPPAFSLPRTELFARAIELAYDRDFSHIPYVLLGLSSVRRTRPCSLQAGSSGSIVISWAISKLQR
jgi:hypothetical protein